MSMFVLTDKQTAVKIVETRALTNRKSARDETVTSRTLRRPFCSLVLQKKNN